MNRDEGRQQPPLVCVVGPSNSGKTTLLVALIKEMKRRGFRVATVKHASHGFDPDRPGKDSWRHITAGADAVAVASPQAYSIYQRQETPPISLEALVHALGNDFDLVLVEGYSGISAPKIEVVAPDSPPPVTASKETIALVTRQPVISALPQFQVDQVGHLVDLIERVVLGHVKPT